PQSETRAHPLVVYTQGDCGAASGESSCSMSKKQIPQNDEDEEDEEEEEDHLASADSAVVVPTVELVSPPERTEPVIPPPSTDITITEARITVWLQASISLPPEAETLRIASTHALIDVVTVALPSPPLPPPLYIPPPVDRMDDIPETELPPRKKSCLFALGPRYKVGEISTARPTGDLAEVVPEIAPMTLGDINTRVTGLAELHEHDTQDLYALLEDAQDSRTRILQRVTIDSQRVDLLMEDRIDHQETILIVEEEAYASQEAWAHSIGLSQAFHYELQTHREQVYAHKSQIPAYEDSAETGPPRAIIYGYDGLPIQPVAPPFSDYVPGPEHPPSPNYEEPFEDEEDDEEEEEEHLASANSSAVPIVDPVLPTGDAEALEADEPTHAPGSPIIIPLSQTRLRKARKTVIPEPPMVAEIRMRALLPSTSHKIDIPEADMPPRKRACLTTPAPGFEVGESSTAGAIVDTLMEIAPTTLEGVNERVTELDTTVRQRTDDFDIRFEEAYDDRAFLRARVNTLFRDRPDHCRTTMLIDREAMYAREAYAYTEDRSLAIAAYVRTIETHVATLIAQTSSLQTQSTTKLGRIEILEARDPEPQEGLVEAGSSSLKRMITDKYCPRGEIQKLEFKYWNFKVKEESDKVEMYIGGLPDMIHGSNNNNQRAQGENARGITCFECRVQGHYKSDCPQLKNENQGNQTGNGNAVARAYAVGTAGTNPNSNVVTGTFLLNNRYAPILFDTGADRSFISTAFSSLADIIPTTLDHGYDVELADGRIIWVNTLIRGCTLNFLNHPFNIDLMPVEMGSFDVIIGMDWLVKYHAVIIYDKELVRVLFGDEILIFHGNGSNNGHESRLNIFSCTKTQRHLLKGCPIFLAHVTTKEAKDKSKEK
nr:reverse transcriptase domain-containing protein [Tanacetum cinerariifolium]